MGPQSGYAAVAVTTASFAAPLISLSILEYPVPPATVLDMYSPFKFSAVFGLALLFSGGLVVGHPADENPDLTLPETTRHFRQERFGMFIHWGIYSVLCDGDTVFREQNLTIPDYERLAGFFNPAEFNAAEWVALAKAAGVHYITFSCKSDDGFCMWDSKASDWNVVKSTPFARDVVKELAAECQREGIKLFLSYSPVNWHQSESRNAGTGESAATTSDDAGTTSPTDSTIAELTELLTKYGKIDGVRLTGRSDKAGAEAQLQPAYQLIRKHQPAALIGNTAARQLSTDEDFQIADQTLLIAPESRTDANLEYTSAPLEVSATINQSRGFRISDHQHKSVRELVHALVRAAGSDANLQLHVGAMPNGQIQQEFADRLRRVGMWLAKNGESIYATRGGPIAPQPWGVTTHRRHRVYVHVLDPETTAVTVQLPYKVRTARYHPDESDVPFEDVDGKVTLTLRPERRGELERLLVLETKHYYY